MVCFCRFGGFGLVRDEDEVVIAAEVAVGGVSGTSLIGSIRGGFKTKIKLIFVN